MKKMGRCEFVFTVRAIGIIGVGAGTAPAFAVDPVCERRVASLNSQLSLLQKQFDQLQASIPPLSPPVVTPAPSVVACRDLTDAQRATPQQACQTSTGAIYTRVTVRGLGQAWRGPDANGVIFSDFMGNFPYAQIQAECARYHAFAATADDYISGEHSNFREVLPGMSGPDGTRYFWTRSQVEQDPQDVYVLHPRGALRPTRIDSANYSLRCVIRP